jgi:N-methylhydantoinase B
MKATGPWSASQEGDGDSFQGVLIYNLSHAGIEMEELPNRSLTLCLSVIPDSGGPGKHRGGASLVCDEWWRVPMSQLPYAFKTRELPAGGGVYGGKAGLLGGIWLWDDPLEAGIDVRAFPRVLNGAFYRSAHPCFGVMNKDTHELDGGGVYFFQTGAVDTDPGSLTRIVSNGGSGWGDPLERDPRFVLRDVRDEYVSIDGAARDYGVVVTGDPTNDPEAVTVDLEATARLRAERRAASGPLPDRVSPSARDRADWPYPTASVEKVEVPGICPECSAEDLKSYPVLADVGWFETVTCQSCLAVVEKKPWRRLGSVRLDGEEFLWP